MIGRPAGLTLAAVLVPRLASACPICFGASEGPMLQGSNLGIFALLVVTLGMLGAFGAFFMMLARRASAAGGHTSERTGSGPHSHRSAPR